MTLNIDKTSQYFPKLIVIQKRQVINFLKQIELTIFARYFLR